MTRKSLQTMHRIAWIGAVVALPLQIAQGVAKEPGAPKRIAERQDGKRPVKMERLHPERYGPALPLLAPEPAPTTAIAATGGINGCWDCDYTPKKVRQFLPGDMTFKFRPVSGTLNYHF